MRVAREREGVAPYMGAWIETRSSKRNLSQKSVAPYMGAWIETKIRLNKYLSALSRTLYGCVD